MLSRRPSAAERAFGLKSLVDASISVVKLIQMLLMSLSFWDLRFENLSAELVIIPIKLLRKRQRQGFRDQAFQRDVLKVQMNSRS